MVAVLWDLFFDNFDKTTQAILFIVYFSNQALIFNYLNRIIKSRGIEFILSSFVVVYSPIQESDEFSFQRFLVFFSYLKPVNIRLVPLVTHRFAEQDIL